MGCKNAENVYTPKLICIYENENYQQKNYFIKLKENFQPEKKV